MNTEKHPRTQTPLNSRKQPRRVTRALAAGGIVLVTALFITACAAETDAAKPDTAAAAGAIAGEEAPVAPAQPTEAEKLEATATLVAAVSQNDVLAAQRAIDAGAYMNERGDLGRTPLVVATKNNQIDMALLLLEAGADPNIQDDIQDSAFLYAGAEGFDEILQATLAHGVDVNLTNRFGGTALIPASEHGYLSTVEILIAAGVPLDHVNNLGWTALHEAIVLNDGGPAQLAVVNALLAAGASPTLPDGDGTSPRDLAASRGYWSIVQAIEAYL